MKDLDTMKVSKVGHGTLPKWWRDVSGLSQGESTCEDSLIAATALFHGHTVATHNIKYFEPAGVNCRSAGLTFSGLQFTRVDCDAGGSINITEE